ncbi:hypothetical protein F5J12DRAFT_780402 [Pisolithus orientalis]|uniref:uncharacterized protein n=1 Tax=Pisolithus orientalis TaxID=936130 RepID=UPI0022246F36|nr:uncharacterized protein F5J12DRAFT_780402 [Pisolithus orientalis]KAI6028882.1 hypothetical protein F5J12DRAFT_780402 [Pisolithus orientalis]
MVGGQGNIAGAWRADTWQRGQGKAWTFQNRTHSWHPAVQGEVGTLEGGGYLQTPGCEMVAYYVLSMLHKRCRRAIEGFGFEYGRLLQHAAYGAFPYHTCAYVGARQAHYLEIATVVGRGWSSEAAAGTGVLSSAVWSGSRDLCCWGGARLQWYVSFDKLSQGGNKDAKARSCAFLPLYFVSALISRPPQRFGVRQQHKGHSEVTDWRWA